MFAPPPIQLSRAQIEQLKLEAEARAREREEKKQAKRKSTESGGSGDSLKKIESHGSLQRTESHSPNPFRRNRLFGRSSKLRVSQPIAQPAREPAASPRHQKQGSDEAAKRDSEERQYSSVPFGEQPRRAPEPPKRPARPSSGLSLFPIGSPVPSERFGEVELRTPSNSPPPVPEKSPRRRSSASRRSQPVQPVEKQPSLPEASVSEALAKLSIDDDGGSPDGKAPHPPQPSTASAVVGRRNSGSTLKTSPTKTSPTRTGAVDKVPGKRASATAAIRAAFLDAEGIAAKSPRRATEGSITPANVSTTPAEVQLPWKRRKKGETMSMLLDSGFFPGGMLTVDTKNISSRTIHVKLPPPLSLIDKDLPDTPDSILATPTELYHSAPRGPLPKTKRKVAAPRRSPLAPLSKTSVKANGGERAADISPTRLSSIPELAGTSENSPLSSGVNTPVATQIHLRGGSVITVTPPELTAWQRHIYVQGPIKLPKPAILPRKNSVATLEAFQEAIDQVYQDALTIPRRRSDDAIVEDICEWFDDFGFEDIGFEGDMLAVDEINVDEVDEMMELDEVDSQGGERFSTPPPEQVASPIEKVVAKEVIEQEAVETSGPMPFPKRTMPPVETEETLRARGIARLSQQARKESLTLSRLEAVIPITPAPETSMLATEVRREDEKMLDQIVDHGGMDQGGMDWDEVEELDEQPAWSAPTIPNNHRGFNKRLLKKDTRNPVTKMRRLMATASAIL
ncbi:hypothetical protein LTR36_002604 [Oleoguttula mirabilis]|uniref:Uncharacterized protein n=1 Tax=Oleoguttula mirabilis TaxID=1507867 RepID=A0AAV9JMD2_9PEZI|nr:hypothetical protein LTR36_002604 [Oleoguttula mirabilis]